MSAFRGHPLRLAGAAVVLFVLIEVLSISVADDSMMSDVRFVIEGILAIVVIGAVVMAVVGRSRPRNRA